MKLFNFCKYFIIAIIAANAYSCSSSDDNTDSAPDWVNTGETNCSTSSTENTGSNGPYYFNQQQDRNTGSSSYGKFRWVADPNMNGRCSGEYTPTFGNTNISTGSYTSFATYGDRVFAAETQIGIVEFVNGQWTTPTGMASSVRDEIFYAKMKEGANGKFFITCSKGIYVQTGNNVYKVAYWTGGQQDMAGGLGGSNTHFFASAGAGWDGIFKWNEAGQNFVATNQIFGCFYSIEALNESEVFFGSGNKSGGTDGKSYGIVRYNGTSIVNTNLTTGEFNLAPFGNKMFAASPSEVYIWDGANFSPIYTEGGGNLCKAGDALYLTNSTGIYKYNGTTFELALEGNYAGCDVLSYEGRLYAFGSSGIKVYYNDAWSDIASSPRNVTTGVASTPGLFVGGTGNNNGIQKMIKSY